MLKRVNVTIQNETLSQQNDSLLQNGRNQEVAKDADCFGKLVSLILYCCAFVLDDFLCIGDIFGLRQSDLWNGIHRYQF